MKASELMIGNWVIVYEKAMPVKARVEGVFGRGAMVLGHVRSADHGFMEPIPLTPEILEKNGFSKSRLMGEQRHFTYYLAPSVSLLAIYDADFSLKIGDCARYIKYVHELQNAISLCGIEKEITI